MFSDALDYVQNYSLTHTCRSADSSEGYDDKETVLARPPDSDVPRMENMSVK